MTRHKSYLYVKMKIIDKQYKKWKKTQSSSRKIEAKKKTENVYMFLNCLIH